MKTLVCPATRGGRTSTQNKHLPGTLDNPSFWALLFKGKSRLRQVGFFLLLLINVISAKAVTKTSTGTGNWNNSGTWTPAGVPADGDNVVIAAGHTVTINANTNDLLNLTINGTLIIGNNNTNRSVIVTGNILINSGGVFTTAGNGGNDLEAGGNLVNNGTLDLNAGTATATVEFNGDDNQLISGTGTTTDFNAIAINNTGASAHNIVEISSSKFTAVSGFLTLTKGILKMSGSFTFSNTFFDVTTPTIHADEGLWLNNPNVTVAAQNGDIQLSGLLRISAGTFNVGTSADAWLYYYTGSELIMEGGALNVSGAFFGASSSQTIKFTQSGGIMTVSTIGNSYSVASFEIKATGSTFTMSGGSIILQKAATSYDDYINNAATSIITGGKIQAGNGLTALSSIFWVSSTPSFYDLEVKLTNNPTFQLRANTNVLHDVTISGILDAMTQNVNLTVGHDWINNGVFLTGTNTTVTFNGSSQQAIGGLLPTTFRNLTINTSGGSDVVLNTATSISGLATFTSGVIVSAAATPLNFLDNATVTGASNNSFVHGPVKKTGNDVFTFPVGKKGAGYHLCGISAPLLVTDIFTAEYMRASASALGTITASGLYSVSNCEYWKLDRTLGLSSVDVTLSWNGTSNCNAASYVNQLSSLAIAHFNGTHWNSQGASSYTGTASSGTIRWNSVSSFSPFSLGSTSSSGVNPLAVKFSSIRAYPSGSDNTIEWTNQTEEGIVSYELERSADGMVFTSAKLVYPKRNDGTKQDYDMIDAEVDNKTIFYRVKAMTTTGAATYSTVVRVNRGLSGEPGIVLYPNPVTGKQFTIQLNSSAGSYLVRVIDQAGQSLLSTNWQHQGGTLSRVIELPAAMAPGIYQVCVYGNEKMINSRIVIQ